ncbi:MAG: type II secretion system protein GspD [SAR86 cluster bacterium]|uniref:Type II secretion system protein GspD n=1 Tax=SAR86 cluster bacterium TaxID=2030880 RepID=A0A2A5B8T2_9GAMM|nr:MAG: type II secretion system protein GspD [SAR86 cluster bacterium]
MKLKHNLLVKKPLCLLAIGLLMSSCSILDASSRGNTQNTSPASAANTARSVLSESSQTEIPVISNAVSSEQQALIDAINRDGDALQFGGYQDSVPAPEQVAGDDVVELNYEQADLRLILEELADALDISIVIDPSIDNKISIRTSEARPLRRDDIWPLIRMLTRDAGVVLDRVGNIYNARKIPSSLPVEIVTPDTLGQGTAARIMQITPLTYVSSEAALQVIEPLLAPDGNVRTLTTNNTLAISASESQLQRINEILFLIDSDPFSNQGIHLYQLFNASAVEVADELAEILQLIEGTTPAYQVKGIERINAILVTAPATRGFEEISRWVQILDADGQEQVEQLFYYKVKNLIAADLAETLSNVFEDDDDDASAGIVARDNSNPVAIGNSIFEDDTDTDGSGGNSPQASVNSNTIAAPVSANLRVKIVADEATNSLLIRSTARDYRQLLTTINQLDAVPLQVMINAVIAQITLTDATQFGVDWSRVAANSAVNNISTVTETAFLPGGGLGGLMFSKAFIDGAARVEATLEAISTNNEVELLARPSLTVANNQEGEIQIGSQVPFQQGESIGVGGISTTNIGYRDTGIVLSITPQINNDGIVNLVIRQELSSVDNSAAGVNGNPVFNNQEINTTVVVRDGENVVLGGLIQTNKESLNTGVPGLNRVPLLGKLFSYQQETIERRELFIVLRPEIINLNSQTGLQYEDILDRFDMASELLEAAGI